ncbi:S-layer homology domain-containing protein [Cytobacillus sp. IB215665]|uniref:S-layer homology domain-containing protein n=1 Tax=Cytobacillus sp. IB215665 TaxID=3097357 RepID=UPI002A0B5F72|nr:S-layer homology domain-containing protein [Cytobacillus sp. IB215665]MDX8365294.1 S-layer homology domain-containing protein [Cytobacillus sp. IB215665]
MKKQHLFWKTVVISMLVSLVVLIQPTIGHSADDNSRASFSDITQGYWASEEITFLTSKGIIKGYNNGEFGPKDNVTRAQAAIMVARALELNTDNITDPKLSDVNDEHSAYKEIAAVIDQGIFDRVGSYYPNEPLTRGEMAKILVRSYELKGNYGEYFTDVSLENEYYPYINKLFANGVTTGFSNKTFKPDQSVTRDQFAVFFARVLDSKFKPSIINNNSLELAKSGILNGCKYSLNDFVTAKDILDDNGEPHWEGYNGGAKGKLFGNCLYYTGDYVDDSDKLITAIDYYTDENTNISIQDIKKLLGEPLEEGYDEMNGYSYMTYSDDAYFLNFIFSDGSPILSAMELRYKMSEEKASYHLLKELGLLNNPNAFAGYEGTQDETSREYYFEVCQNVQHSEEEAQCVPLGFYYVDKFTGDIRQSTY